MVSRHTRACPLVPPPAFPLRASDNSLKSPLFHLLVPLSCKFSITTSSPHSVLPLRGFSYNSPCDKQKPTILSPLCPNVTILSLRFTRDLSAFINYIATELSRHFTPFPGQPRIDNLPTILLNSNYKSNPLASNHLYEQFVYLFCLFDPLKLQSLQGQLNSFQMFRLHFSDDELNENIFIKPEIMRSNFEMSKQESIYIFILKLFNVGKQFNNIQIYFIAIICCYKTINNKFIDISVNHAISLVKLVAFFTKID